MAVTVISDSTLGLIEIKAKQEKKNKSFVLGKCDKGSERERLREQEQERERGREHNESNQLAN